MQEELDIKCLVLPELVATAVLDNFVPPHALSDVKLELAMLNLFAKIESTFLVIKDTFATLLELDSTNVSEILTAQTELLQDLNSWIAQMVLNVDVEILTKSALLLL